MPSPFRAALLAGILLACGCTLIDQRTFAPPQPAGAAEQARAKLPALPLAIVRFNDPDTDWRIAVAAAVNQALQRRPGASFDVLASVPLGAAPLVQDEAAIRGQADTRAVADALLEAGVASDQLYLGLRGDPGTPPREVRIYVR